MGTDIHLFTETREPKGWRLARVEHACTWCPDSRGTYRSGQKCFECKGTGRALGYSDRNYRVFAMLADVRNGFGFAGVPTHDRMNVIAPQRGIPRDIDPKLARYLEHYEACLEADQDEPSTEVMEREYGSYSLGDHSCSWLTLRELLDFDWSQVTWHRGTVALEEYRRWRKTTERTPREWSGGVSGGGAVTLTEGDPRVTDLPERAISNYYVEAFWTETYADSAGSFYSVFVPALVALRRDPRDVRIVFGFDS